MAICRENTPTVHAVLSTGYVANVTASCSLAEYRGHVERLLGRQFSESDESVFLVCVRRNRTAAATAEKIRQSSAE